MSIKRLGVIGGGQLAWMMGDAASSLGIELVIQTPHPTDPAVSIASDTIFAAVDDASETINLARCCDAITFENEFINLGALRLLEESGVEFRPKLDSLAPLLDKYDQRCFLQDLGLTVPRFVAIQQVPVPEHERYTEEERAAMEAQEKDFIPPPPPEPPPDTDPRLVIKVRRLGYDGQGIFIVEEKEEFWGVLDQLGQTPAILEQFIPFERELAVVAARSIEGEIVVYPVVETQQVNHVCRRVLAPADISSAINEEVEAIARTILDKLQVVGVFGIELFLTPEGQVIVNEVSPRTHNSGHYTIDACKTSQFEQHLRAVCGLPLGEVDLLKPAVMVNLLGYEHSQTEFYSLKRQLIAAIPNARVHWYGKTESRPGRKLGHVTVLLDEPSANQRDQLLELARQVESIWYGEEN